MKEVSALKLNRETKGAVLYKNVVDHKSVTTIYLRKAVLDTPYPSHILVTISTEENLDG